MLRPSFVKALPCHLPPPRGRLDIRLKFFTLYFLYFYSLFSLFFIRKGVETLDDVNLFRIVRVEVFTI